MPLRAVRYLETASTHLCWSVLATLETSQVHPQTDVGHENLQRILEVVETVARRLPLRCRVGAPDGEHMVTVIEEKGFHVEEDEGPGRVVKTIIFSRQTSTTSLI